MLGTFLFNKKIKLLFVFLFYIHLELTHVHVASTLFKSWNTYIILQDPLSLNHGTLIYFCEWGSIAPCAFVYLHFRNMTREAALEEESKQWRQRSNRDPPRTIFYQRSYGTFHYVDCVFTRISCYNAHPWSSHLTSERTSPTCKTQKGL